MKRIVHLSMIILLTVVASCTEVPPYRLEKGELFPCGKLVGQPISPKMTEIRMVRVSSIQEADSFFVALCLNDNHDDALSYECSSRDRWHYRSGTTGGEMIYTHKVPSGTHEVGVIYIQDSIINARGIKEIHFVGTIKSEELKQKRVTKR